MPEPLSSAPPLTTHLGVQIEREEEQTIVHFFGGKRTFSNETFEKIQRIHDYAVRTLSVAAAVFIVSQVPLMVLVGICMPDVIQQISDRIQEAVNQLKFEGYLFTGMLLISSEEIGKAAFGGAIALAGLHVGSRIHYHGHDAFHRFFNPIGSSSKLGLDVPVSLQDSSDNQPPPAYLSESSDSE